MDKETSDAINFLKQKAGLIEDTKDFENDINWLFEGDDYYNSWPRIKRKNMALLRDSEELFQLFGSCDMIIGKPQIREDNKKTNITLIVKAIKKDKDTGEDIAKYKFVDDYYNKRDDGYEADVLEKSFWVYDVIYEGESYIIFCDEKIGNQETHTFYGMKIKVPHKKEFDKNLACRGSANLFFCKKAESTVKPIPKEKIISSVKLFLERYSIKEEEYKSLFLDYPFIHDNGNIYRQPLDYMLLRHSQLLSGKEEDYPLQLIVWSSAGLGKTCEAECANRIFMEGILEAANSTPKALVQSFKEKPANPGFILSKNRIAIIDELMKMIDNAANSSRSLNDVKNQLGQLNMILEQKERTVGSGNDNTLTCKATAKTFFLTNPSMRCNYLYEEIGILDPTTVSRVLNWVKDEEHIKFIEGNVLEKCAETHPIYYRKNEVEKENILYKGMVYAPKIRDFYVSIYDSCQVFRSNVDFERVKKIFQTLVAISKDPMKTIWKRRGLHHTQLVLDGLVKFRCIFQDFDDSFEAKDVDYDNLERILIRMVKSWDTNMGIKKKWDGF